MTTQQRSCLSWKKKEVCPHEITLCNTQQLQDLFTSTGHRNIKDCPWLVVDLWLHILGSGQQAVSKV